MAKISMDVVQGGIEDGPVNEDDLRLESPKPRRGFLAPDSSEQSAFLRLN